MSLLELAGISHGFGELSVVQDVTLRLAPGEQLGLLGPSGAGKTTLLRIAAGLLHPDRGQVLLSGQDVTGQPGSLALMQQEDLLLSWFRLLDNVALPLRISGQSRAAAARRATAELGAFGLSDFVSYFPAQLSGGMRQRASLARTLLQDSPALLLDEPFGALDAITRASLHGWLQQAVQSRGRATLLVTHDVHEAVILCDRVLVLSERPAQPVGEVLVDLPRPRDTSCESEPAYQRARRDILDLLAQVPQTSDEPESAPPR